MRVKNSNLEWYVLKYDANSDSIVTYNVMTGIAELLYKKVKKKEVYNRASLKEFLKKEFMYNYWSRTEYEILVSGLSSDANIEKIDIYEQLEMNLDNITDYVNLKCDLRYKIN
jgi:hypothetical protein